jgi:hypothetical protein
VFVSSVEGSAQVTFLIERVTPGKLMYDRRIDGPGQSLRYALPLEVEVELEDRASFDSICECSLVYRLTDEAVRWLRKRDMYPRRLNGRANACVCSCMGQIVGDVIDYIADTKKAPTITSTPRMSKGSAG